MKTIEDVKKAAKKFLKIADKLNEGVSNYLCGSNNQQDFEDYFAVKQADKKFIDTVNEFYGCREYEYGLNYELAYSFIG